MSTYRNGSPSKGGGRRLVQGFTLVETLIALLLLAIITVIMVGVLRTASQTWSRVTSHQDAAENRLVLNQFLRRHLSDIRFMRVRTVKDQVIYSFLGDERALHYVAPFPSHESDGHLYWWTLTNQIDESSGHRQLALQYRPFHKEYRVEIDDDGLLTLFNPEAEEDDDDSQRDDSDEDFLETIVLAENVTIDAVEFFRRAPFGEEEWLDKWEPLALAPMIIRLTIAGNDHLGESYNFPEIAVTPRFKRGGLHGRFND